MSDRVDVVCDWFFEVEGERRGPFRNFITAVGYQTIADMIGAVPSPYLVVGDDDEPGETIVEVFRKPVSAVITEGRVVRFRTQLLPDEANGDHKKASIFIEASEVTGSGKMLNLLRFDWSKSANMVMTIEARFTVGGS